MRTVKRQVAAVSPEPMLALRSLVTAANREKAFWLGQLRGYEGFRCLANARNTLRDPAVRAGYESAYGLSARQWKSALDEAVGMADRFWKAHFVGARSVLYRLELGDAQRHYCFSILRDYGKLYDLFKGQLPQLPVASKAKKSAGKQSKADALPARAELTKADQIVLAHRLRELIRRNMPTFPSVKLARSVVLDQNCYRISRRDGVQVASVATLARGKRLDLPLKGYCATPTSRPRTHRATKKTDHYGTVRIVVDGEAVALHTTFDTDKAARRAALSMTAGELALDAGYTDTFADQHGAFYGRGLGTCLLRATDALHDKGVARNKLHALEKKYRTGGRLAKANAMRRCNLGTKKQIVVRQRQQATVERIINTAVNEVLAKKPGTLIREQLSQAFSFKLGRKANRRLSAWTRGRIVERCDYKASLGGTKILLANSAYSSQECCRCGWVEQSNREAHDFKCRQCGHGTHAGENAAGVLVRRVTDPEITLYTPVSVVKKILLARYQATQHGCLETAAQVRAMGTVAADSRSCRLSQADDKRASANG